MSRTAGNAVILAALAILSAPLALLAQTTTTPTPAPRPTVGQRKENQQDRIAQGVKSGQLTAGEASSLESQQAGINKETRSMRAADNGKLTGADKRAVRSQQNQQSRRIYRAKHNAAKQ